MGTSLVSFEAVQNGPHTAPNNVAKVLSNEQGREEVETLLREHKRDVRTLLQEDRDLVGALRDALIEHEELLGEEILAVLAEAESRRPPAELPG